MTHQLKRELPFRNVCVEDTKKNKTRQNFRAVKRRLKEETMRVTACASIQNLARYFRYISFDLYVKATNRIIRSIRQGNKSYHSIYTSRQQIVSFDLYVKATNRIIRSIRQGNKSYHSICTSRQQIVSFDLYVKATNRIIRSVRQGNKSYVFKKKYICYYN